MRTSIPILLALFSAPVWAQDPTLVLEEYRSQWKDQPGVFIKMNTTVRIQKTDDGVVATKTVEHERIALKAPSGQSEQDEVGYSGLVPLEEINAWTMVPKDKSYKKFTVTEFKHRDEIDNQVFHDDSRSVQFLYPAMSTGAIAHLDYTVRYPDARMVTGHYFASGYPVKESVLTVIVDKDVDVDGTVFHAPEGALKRETTTERGKTVHRWTMSNVAAVQFEDDAPGFRYFMPHVQLVVRKPGEKGGTDLERMYAWNREHIRSVMLDDDTALVRIAKDVTQGLSDDRAKAAALYTWVQDHIKYIAVEDGMNGLIPAKPAEVCQARYGDCKGMANLLRSLFANAGLKAHLVWVGSRALPYRYDELPSPVADDHMITAWEHGGEFLLLDPTSNETPFGMPSGFIQGKQALIALDEEHFKVVEVPVMPAAMNNMVDTVRARLEGGVLKGSGHMTFTGYQRGYMSELFKAVEKKRWKEVLRTRFMKANNRFQFDTVYVTGLDDRTGPLVMHYTFTLPGATTSTAGEEYLPRVMVNSLRNRNYRKDRVLPVEEDYLWMHEEHVFIELPTGTTVAHVPQAAAHDGPGHGYSMSSAATPPTKDRGAVLEFHNAFRMEKLMLLPADLVAWRTMMDQLDRDMNRTIVLNTKP